MGVVFLFGTQAARLGFMVTLVQAEFPDCEAFVEVAPNRLQRLRIEFEKESRNFLKHGHDPNGCDLIVCWEHNWPECPVEVLALRDVILGQQLAPVERQNLPQRHGSTEKIRTLPLKDTDDTERKSGDRVIARDRVIENQEGLPRMKADERGSEEEEELTTD
jgi:hypothetical protein